MANESIIISSPAKVSADLPKLGVLSYKLGQWTAPNYGVNLTTDNPDECYLKVNGNKVTGAYFVAPNAENLIEIYGKYSVKKLPSIDANSVIELSDLAYFDSLVQFIFTDNSKTTGVKGSINSLSRLVNLTDFELNKESTLSGDVTGDLNELLDSLYANGKTSGELYLYAANLTSVTYNGSPISSPFSKHFDFDENGWTERT